LERISHLQSGLAYLRAKRRHAPQGIAFLSGVLSEFCAVGPFIQLISYFRIEMNVSIENNLSAIIKLQ